MTHTLHRLGNAESLKDDYIVLIMKNRSTSRKPAASRHVSKFRANKPLKRIMKGFLERNPKMASAMRRMRWNVARVPKLPGALGKFEESLLRSALPSTIVFNNKADLITFLRRLRKLDIGQSVVVSGLFSEVHESLKEIGIRPHTVELSLGIFGNKTLLPKEGLLQLTTMCGHHLISPRLVEKLCCDAKTGRLNYEEAAEGLAKQCFCGAFNTKRAVRLMKAFNAGEG